MGAVWGVSGRGLGEESQGHPKQSQGMVFRKEFGTKMEIHEKGPKAPKFGFLHHPSAFTPSWPEGKGSFLVVGFGATWAPFEHLVAVLLMSAAWALEFWEPWPTDPIVCANIWGREVSERTSIGKLISSNSPLGNFAFPKRTSFSPRG